MLKPSRYLECGLKLSFPGNLCRALDQSAETVFLEKGCTVLDQGEKPDFIYFISEGLMREYYIDSEGNDKGSLPVLKDSENQERPLLQSRH